MTIRSLSQPALRAIGAGQVLVDPTAVVKELVDNALDAHATSISVHVSHNTIDLIKVRDNGHGIAPADRSLVARRHCTSKIVDEDDIRFIGGSFLGFRGEALASTAELSESLTISTRIEGEQTSTVLSLSRQGEVEKKELSSLSVGTTVQITNFLAHHPVRRQASQRCPEKSIKTIRHLLQTYAFARPNVRLSFQVVSTNNARHDLVYAPNSSNDVRDVAFKLLGAACAGQCTRSHVAERGFRLHSLLPQPNAEPRKISGFGSYISIDARPVSPVKGAGRKITKSFREVLKQVNTTLGGVKEPFLYLEISCPAGTYDVNVEPAKDDVLFEDPKLVLEIVKKMFNTFYGLKQIEIIGNPGETPGSSSNEALFELKHHKTSPTVSAQRWAGPAAGQGRSSSTLQESSCAVSADQGSPISNPSTSRTQLLFNTNMFAPDEDGVSLFDVHQDCPSTTAESEVLQEAKMHISLSNPWVLAKLYTSQRPGRHDGSEARATETENMELSSTDIPVGSGDPVCEPPASSTRSLPSTWPSSSLELSTVTPPRKATARCHEQSQSKHQNRPASWQQPLSTPFDRAGQVASASSLVSPVSWGGPPSGSTSTLPIVEESVGTPLTQIPDASTRPHPRPKPESQQSGVNKPFVVTTENRRPMQKVWFDHLEDSCNVQRRPKAKQYKSQQDGIGLVTQGERHMTNKLQTLLPTNCRGTRPPPSATSPGGAELLQIPNKCQGSQAFTSGTIMRTILPRNDAAPVEERLGDCEPASSDTAHSLEPYNESPITQLMRIFPGDGRSEGISAMGESSRHTSPVSVGLGSTAFHPRESEERDCTKSQLALESTPVEQRTRNLVQTLTVSVPEIARLTVQPGTQSPLPRFSDKSATDLLHSTLKEPDLDMQTVVEGVHVLLSNTGSGTPNLSADDLLKILQAAFHASSMVGHVQDDVLDVK